MLPLMAAYGNINYLCNLSLYYWHMSALFDNDKQYTYNTRLPYIPFRLLVKITADYRRTK